jgi:hypothetical protein
MEQVKEVSFTYQEQLESEQIRTLQLQPGKSSEMVECKLKVATLGTAYKALSYAWGDPTPTHKIICNGKSLTIASNLHAALWQFRENEEFGFLWADAICINQADLEEKTRQVRMMRQVYENAGMVLIWLGIKEAKDEPGLKLLSEIDTKLGLLFRDEKDEAEREFHDPRVEQFGLPAAGLNSPWRSLSGIYRPWFGRVWVVQEFVCAKEWEFHLGSTRIPSHILLGGARRVTTKDSPLRTALEDSTEKPDEAVNAARLAVFKKHHNERSEMTRRKTTVELLWMAATFKATESRDNIFALVGLLDGIPSDIVDYNLDLRNILIQLACNFLVSEKLSVFDILTYVSAESKVPQLPSWVPDWSIGPVFVAANIAFHLVDDSISHGPPEVELIDKEVSSA